MDFISYLKSVSLEELQKIQEFITNEIKRRRSDPKRLRKVITFTDGASRGNPGHAGIGALIFTEDGEKIVQEFQYIGETTNNEAEYRALLLALDRAYDLTHEEVQCYMDSQLLVRQLNGQYALKSEKMAKFYDEVQSRISKFSSVKFSHVPRENPRLQMADKLANKAIDEARVRKQRL